MRVKNSNDASYHLKTRMAIKKIGNNAVSPNSNHKAVLKRNYAYDKEMLEMRYTSHNRR